MAVLVGFVGLAAGFALGFQPVRHVLGWLLLAGFIWLNVLVLLNQPFPTFF